MPISFTRRTLAPALLAASLAAAAISLALAALTACTTQPDPTALERAPTPTEPNPTVESMPRPTATPALAIPAQAFTDSIARDQLDVVIPPCIPYPGSDIDPCERRATWRMPLHPDVHWDIAVPDVVPSIEDVIAGWESIAETINAIVRTTVIPGSTRCSEPSHRCVTDIVVNEYIAGTGPGRLTVHTGVDTSGCVGSDEVCVPWYERKIGEIIEGREWILFIGNPPDLWIAVWGIASLFRDVQQLSDDTVVVVAWEKIYYDDAFYDYRDIHELKAQNASRLEMTLDEFRPAVKAAHQKYVEAKRGRNTTERDYLGREYPMLSTDVGAESLTSFLTQIISLNELDLTPVDPPPVPGENDPNPDGLRINDIIATRVAGGVPIPGN